MHTILKEGTGGLFINEIAPTISDIAIFEI